MFWVSTFLLKQYNKGGYKVFKTGKNELTAIHYIYMQIVFCSFCKNIISL